MVDEDNIGKTVTHNTKGLAIIIGTNISISMYTLHLIDSYGHDGDDDEIDQSLLYLNSRKRDKVWYTIPEEISFESYSNIKTVEIW